jgi:hypothetical protein
MEYALKYQDNLKGLIISNMVASVPEYNKYAQEVLGPQLPEEVLPEIKATEANKDYTNPRYEALLMSTYYILLKMAVKAGTILLQTGLQMVLLIVLIFLSIIPQQHIWL